MLGRYRKAVGAFCAALLAWAGAVVASSSGPITASEWLALGGVVYTTLVVGMLTNDPPAAPPSGVPMGNIVVD